MKYWEDFQSKWGFEDGDSVPPDALLLRQVYVRELNRELRKRKSGVRLLAWDRPGMHNPLLIVRILAESVRKVPLGRLCVGQMAGGYDPEPGWQEPEPDTVFDQVIEAAQELDLDGMVETRVTLRRVA